MIDLIRGLSYPLDGLNWAGLDWAGLAGLDSGLGWAGAGAGGAGLALIYTLSQFVD